MTGDLIATGAGLLISILLEVIPGLKTVWANWKWKPLTLLGGFIFVPVLLWLLVCPLGLDFGLKMDCSWEGLLAAVLTGLTAFGGNQAMFNVALRKKLANIVNRNLEVA